MAKKPKTEGNILMAAIVQKKVYIFGRSVTTRHLKHP